MRDVTSMAFRTCRLAMSVMKFVLGPTGTGLLLTKEDETLARQWSSYCAFHH